MVQVVVAVGGNVGDVRETLRRARKLIEAEETVHKLRAAELYRSVAMGADAGGSFLNSAWVFETSLDALELLDLLQRAENELGRTREVRWGPRTLDLDLIFYGEEQIDSPRLTVPHPHCWYRQFVLAPVSSLVPEFVHPDFGLTIRQLHERLTSCPFVVAWSGEAADRDLLERLCLEFPRVDLPRVDSVGEVEGAEASLGFRFGNAGTMVNEPFRLHVPSEGGQQFVHDVLTAACIDVELVD